MGLVDRYQVNENGRDFIVGDIHGMFTWLDRLLIKVKFDPTKDRLFSVGDLVDRGPESIRSLEYLGEKWFHAVKGNHEEMIEDNIYDYSRHWLRDLTNQEIINVQEAFSAMPLVIEVETTYGLIGIVHAEVPYMLNDWNEFVLRIDTDKSIQHEAKWGRTRTDDIDAILNATPSDIKEDYFKVFLEDSKFRDSVKNINYTFHGHSIIRTPLLRGNQIFLDTGAFAKYNGTFNRGSLTLIDFTDINNFKVHSYYDFEDEYYKESDFNDIATRC